VTKKGAVLWIAGSVAAAVLVFFFGWALFVPAADWLARQDIGNATGTSLETARNNARGNLLALAAGIAGLGALFFTSRNFALQRRTFQLAEKDQQRTHELTEQGQVTDRYTKAIEQLGSEKLDIRIGGIYALERIARDSARDHPTVIEVLTTFIREHSPASEVFAGSDTTRAPRVQADIQAALSVIRRRDPRRDIGHITLSETNLASADLTGVDLTGADLTGAHLADTSLSGAHMAHARMAHAILTGAHLVGVDLTDADLTGADLTGAHLAGAILTKATLCRAILTGARMVVADLTGADLTGAIPAPIPMPTGWRVNDDGRIERVP
jgi:uncharacterized protein YjbI with pentapeptide repeats